MAAPTEPRSCPCKTLPWSISSFTAAEYGDVHTLLNKKKTRVVADSGGLTPLHYAAQHGHVSATVALLQRGDDVNGKTPSRTGYTLTTPLHRASFSGAVTTVKILLDYNAEIQAMELPSGMYPLHKAVAGGRPWAVRLLCDELKARGILKQGMKDEDGRGRTPLELAKLYVETEDPASVARWDALAAGRPANWGECVAILQEEWDAMNEGGKSVVSPSVAVTGKPIPTSLTKNACLNCDEDDGGSCLTVTWERQFMSAFCVAAPPSRKKKGVSDIGKSGSPNGDDSGNEVASQKEIDHYFSTTMASSPLCMNCNQPTFALHAVVVKERSPFLVCKSCRRKLRAPLARTI